jgi:hypothetical protein
MTPVDTHQPTPRTEILLQDQHPYDPPTYRNNSRSNRPNAATPTAFIHHLRYGCASEPVLRPTQCHVKGIEVHMYSWKQLTDNLPCDGCLAGKLRKTKKEQSSAFTPAYNVTSSWTPRTANYFKQRQLIPGKNNVVALFLDLNTCGTAVYPQSNRGLAGESLEQYLKYYVSPSAILHDNTAEYIHGAFDTLCRQKGNDTNIQCT